MKKKKKVLKNADDLLEQEIGSNLMNYKFQHYQFELELEHNDKIDELKKQMDNMHI